VEALAEEVTSGGGGGGGDVGGSGECGLARVRVTDGRVTSKWKRWVSAACSDLVLGSWAALMGLSVPMLGPLISGFFLFLL
jgi:hypothetical protein